MTLRPAIPLYQQRGSVLVTGPTVEPVTIEELWAHLRTDEAEFPEALDYITDARQQIEQTYGVAMLQQTWRLSIDRWPGGAEAWWDGVRQMAISELYAPNYMTSVFLPRWPLVSITSVTVFDEDSNSQAVTVQNTFDVDTYSVPGRLTLKRGSTWPIALRANNAIQIVYVAGTAAQACDVPQTYKRAVRQLAAYNYAHRGDGCDPVEAMQKSGVEQIMGAYRPMRV